MAIYYCSTIQRCYKNGTSLGDKTRSSSVDPPNENFLIGAMPAIPYFSDYQISIAFVGGNLTDTQNTNLYNAVQAYMTSLGKQV